MARTPDEIRRTGNHLAQASSAYLLMHAHNPVEWYPWGPEALALAVKLDRPIFLSIGYVSCHWCHVMEAEDFSQDDVAQFLNQHFVSIKVDREERPDLDAAYMSAVERMTGSGGWPMTVLLTPTLQPFFGATYLPHDDLLRMLGAAAEEFRSQRNGIESRASELYNTIVAESGARAKTHDAALLTAAELRSLARDGLANLDTQYGGFVGRQKFPTPIRWRFLLHSYRKWGDADIGAALRTTLEAMANGGIRDQIAGGFFRYTTEPSWTVPHFEKMLYDNAQLAALYLESSVALGEPRYEQVALDTLDFLLREMQLSNGGFGASFDADSAGKEGAAYLWTPTQLSDVAKGDDAALLATLLGVSDAGNFELDGARTNIPTWRALTQLEPAERKNATEVWEHWRSKLLEARAARPQPSFDRKLVTAWNGLAISALALGYRASADARYRDAATRAADAVWRSNRTKDGELTRASTDGHGSEYAVLDDYAALATGYLDLFEATGSTQYLQRSVALTEQALTRFHRPEGDAWYVTAKNEPAPLGRRVELFDSVEPSGNAALLSLLVRLTTLTGRHDFEAASHAALAQQAANLRQRGLEMAGWLDAALIAAGPSYDVVVAGVDTLGSTHDLMDAWTRLLAPWITGVTVAANGASRELEALMPAAAGKTDSAGKPFAYVCTHGACKFPSSEAAQVHSEVMDGWLH